MFNYVSLICRKTSNAKTAKSHLKKVCEILEEKDKSLVKLASEHFPQDDSDKAPKTKKRKSATTAEANNNKKKKPAAEKSNTANMTLGEREIYALQALEDFVEQKGGSRDSVKNFKCRVIRKPSDGRFDTKYYNEDGKPFRSMMEVGRYLNLIAELAPEKKKLAFAKRKASVDVGYR